MFLRFHHGVQPRHQLEKLAKTYSKQETYIPNVGNRVELECATYLSLFMIVHVPMHIRARYQSGLNIDPLNRIAQNLQWSGFVQVHTCTQWCHILSQELRVL